MAHRVTFNYIASISATTLLLARVHTWLCTCGAWAHGVRRRHPQPRSRIPHRGILTTHSTKGQILDHTVLRNWEKKNQCNYSEKNDFCYKCRSSGVPPLNRMGRAWLCAGISVIIMSANSYRHEEECGYISFSPLTDLALWACCRVESSSLCPAGTVALRPRPLAPLWRLRRNPGRQKKSKPDQTLHDHLQS